VAFRPNWYDNNSSGGRAWLSRSIRDWTAIRLIFTLCAAFYVIELLLLALGGPASPGLDVLFDLMALRSWNATETGPSFNFLFPVQLVTYMLLHSPGDMWHLFWNMVLMWMFGRELEGVMGKRAFLRMFIAGGILGALLQWGSGLVTDSTTPTIGASGAVYTIMMMYTLRWPRRTILLFPFMIPVPVVLIMAFKLAGDFMGFMGGGGHVAHLVHLGGALMGYIWFKRGDFVGRIQTQHQRKAAQKVAEEKTGERREMDRILAKIQASGLSSLDKKERSFLDRRSKELRESR